MPQYPITDVVSGGTVIKVVMVTVSNTVVVVALPARVQLVVLKSPRSMDVRKGGNVMVVG
jgi:hypothetical protein